MVFTTYIHGGKVHVHTKQGMKVMAGTKISYSKACILFAPKTVGTSKIVLRKLLCST